MQWLRCRRCQGCPSRGALRSQVSSIEQDIFLFSRSIRENIAFSLGGDIAHASVEQAAREAQAHDFIIGFKDGYETVVGERGFRGWLAIR